MARYVRQKDLMLFVEMAHEPKPRSIDDVSMRVLAPAYVVSELKARISDRGGVVFAVSCCGHRRGGDYELGGYDAAAAGGDLDAVEAFAVPDGGWVAPADWSAGEELQLMGTDQVVMLGRSMLVEVAVLVAPLLLIVIAVSFVISILQVLTSLQDQTLAAVPRLLATGWRCFF